MIKVRLKPLEATALGLTVKSKFKDGNPRYNLDEKQLFELNNLRNFGNTSFKEVKRTLDKNGNVVSKVEKLGANTLINTPNDHVIKRVSTNVSTNQQWIITEPAKKLEDVIDKIDFEEIIKKYIEPIETKFVSEENNEVEFDRLVYTDVHIGMTTNENGHSLYGGKWDAEEIDIRLNTIIQHVIKNKQSNTLVVDERGDFMDGWDGQTTRKGHDLPQNMDNEKAFDTGLRFKIKMLDSIVNFYDRIILHNVCNDNHAGSFGYVVNSAFKQIAEHRYNSVTVVNMRKFMDNYVIGKRCFILCHGKDSKALKFGFKPKLDPAQIEKIKNYIDENKLHNYKIEFSKGDSHQKLIDESSSDAFDYYNYGALSPSSEWVQTNFKKGKSFFEFFTYLKNGQKEHRPYVFDWNINRKDKKRDYKI